MNANLKKGLLVLLCIAMAGMVLGGCAARSASGTTAPMTTSSPMATAQASASPDAQVTGEGINGVQSGTMMGPTASASPDAMNETNGAMSSAASSTMQMTPAQADRKAEQIEEALERISEIDDAEVVIADDSRVLVAVEFEDQYKAGLDKRMKNMIVEAVQKVDDGLTDIEITDDGTLYGQVKGLGERLAKATGLDELADDFGDLWDRVTGM